MTSKPTKQHVEDAMSWLLRLEGAEGDAGLRAQHRVWLHSNPDHEIAWQKATKAWSVAGKTATRSEPPTAETDKVLSFAAPRRRAAVWAAVAAAACLAAFVAPQLWLRTGTDFSTQTAELRTVQLSDGSTVQLDARSSIAVELKADRRAVKLLGGRAFFDVAKDASRPFTVTAGDVDITVLGTSFDVRLGEQEVSVAVQRGSVQVRQTASHFEQQLSPGDQVTIAPRSGATHMAAIQPSEIAAWRDGKLSAVKTPLSEVVAELRRYHKGWIVIADDRLGAEPITGLYDLKTPDLALRAMMQPVNGSIREITPYLTILSQAGK
jgi:transmembrane sensor